MLGNRVLNHRYIVPTAAAVGALAVTLGAFGAHWLAGAVEDWGLSAEEQARRLDIWDVAVRYQMYHALALLGVGLLDSLQPRRTLRVAAILFLVGTAIFSGCLYALVLSGVKILGAIVPIGGTALIAGWVVLGVGAWSSGKG